MNDRPMTNFSEAPASWNVRYTMNGYVCQFTLRGDTGSELLPKAEAALAWLAEHGAIPEKLNGNGGAPAPAPKAEGSFCQIHNCEMKQHTKDGKSWWSHKLDDGSYCKGK